MPNTYHTLTLIAFPRKEELGGGYRGKVADRRTSPSTIHESEVLPTREAATHWVKAKAHELLAGTFYQLAPMREPDGYRANVWTR